MCCTAYSSDTDTSGSYSSATCEECNADSNNCNVKKSSPRNRKKSSSTCGQAKTRCDPCRCKLDKNTGKRVKTQECREAAKERRRQRREAQKKCEISDINSNNFILRKLSGMQLALNATPHKWNFNENKENANITDTIFCKQKEMDKSTYCDFSDSSSV